MASQTTQSNSDALSRHDQIDDLSKDILEILRAPGNFASVLAKVSNNSELGDASAAEEESLREEIYESLQDLVATGLIQKTGTVYRRPELAPVNQTSTWQTPESVWDDWEDLDDIYRRTSLRREGAETLALYDLIRFSYRFRYDSRAETEPDQPEASRPKDFTYTLF